MAAHAVAQAEAPNPPEEFTSWPYRYFRFQLRRDKPDEARNVLLVVATLIAAVTFQAGVNPPGGVWQGDPNDHGRVGKSIFASVNPRGFTIFLVFNTLAFGASSTLIFFLVLGCPFSLEVQIALISMALTYSFSIDSMMPPGYNRFTAAVSLAFIFPSLLRYVYQLLKKKYCKLVEHTRSPN